MPLAYFGVRVYIAFVMDDILRDSAVIGGLPPLVSGDNRVVVAMSGGVDSSVVAALCSALGYEVIGITLQLYSSVEVGVRGKSCCAGRDIGDARSVADRMGFSHYVLDYEDRFRSSVIDDFADSYLRGETPVPCIRCNQSVKFSDLLSTSKDLGASSLVTGHYVRRGLGVGGGVELLSGIDMSKDQSYFLFSTSSEQLDYVYFPLGEITKAETRSLARYFGLSVSEKVESQDICFVASGRYGDLVRRLRPGGSVGGEIVHVDDGRVLGYHDGIVDYTVGQRRGLGIGGRSDETSPLYVISLDVESNRVVVGDYSALAISEILVRDVNWLGDELFSDLSNYRVMIKYRSGMARVGGFIDVVDGVCRVRFSEPQHGVSGGQACVFYAGDRVLGGGWIERI